MHTMDDRERDWAVGGGRAEELEVFKPDVVV